MPSSIAPQIFKIPLHIPSFTSSSTCVFEKVLIPTSSSLSADNIHVSSPETSIPISTSTSQAVVVQTGSSPLLSVHITMPIPSVTITQTSSLVSTGIDISSTDGVRDDFNEDIVISLGDYFYDKSNKAVVKRGKKRSKNQGDVDTSLSNQVVWTQ